MTKKKFFLILYSLFFALSVYPHIVLAEQSVTFGTAGGDLSSFIGDFYTWSVGAGGALVVAMIVLAGYDYATSGGDVEKINAAKEKIIGAIIGLLLLVLAALIFNALSTSNPTSIDIPDVAPADAGGDSSGGAGESGADDSLLPFPWSDPGGSII